MIARLTVDLGALRRNVARLATLVAPARYAAVVKADAYGHGLVRVARALDGDVAGFCVYRFDEAATLRAQGIRSPVLVLGPVEANDLARACELDVSLALWSRGAFLRDAVRAASVRDARLGVHVKVDTGVTRLGLDAGLAPAALGAYLAEPALDVRGVFTHLAAAEELESAYTLAQLARFETVTQSAAGALHARGAVRHAAASAAAMLFPASRYDLVRGGIATYGIWPSNDVRTALACPELLEPALAWTTELVVVRAVEAGRSVGYGCTHHTSRASLVGVLPIGYAEGLPRALSNGGVALVGGRRAAFIGRVCMNMSFLDVTDVPGVHSGMPVTLLGRDGDQTLDANELAAAAGTIGYEVVARLPTEVPRRYTVETPQTPSGRRFALFREN